MGKGTSRKCAKCNEVIDFVDNLQEYRTCKSCRNASDIPGKNDREREKYILNELKRNK